jgi:hypothetical protein
MNASETFSLCEFFILTYVLPLMVQDIQLMELIPMLIGFFTYKIAMFPCDIKDVRDHVLVMF